MLRKTIESLIAVIGFLPLVCDAAVQTTESVQQLAGMVEKAITTHPEVSARFHDFTSSLEGQSVAGAGWRPKVTAQGWAGNEWRSHMAGQANYNWQRPGWQLDLRQLIFDGGTTTNAIRQAGFEKLSGYYELMAVIDKLANDTVVVYLDVLQYRETQRLARENFNLHSTILQQLQERLQSGVGRGVDLEQANGRLALAQTNLMTESSNLNEVSQRYRRVVGIYPAAVMEPVVDVTPQLPALGEQDNFAASLRVNPSLLSKQALVQAAQAGEKSSKSSRAPLVELRAGVGRDRTQPDGVSRDMQSANVQVLMTYNLYRGGADEARVRQTAAQAYAARDVLDYTCRNLQQELSITWNSIIRLRQQIPFLREHQMSTSKVRVAYQQQFQIGQRSLLDMLDTENELFDARRSLIHAQYDLLKMQYQWLSRSSKLLPVLGLTPPHGVDLPAEQQSLVLPDALLQVCMAPTPDTSNLTPITKYGEGDKPPLLDIAPKH